MKARKAAKIIAKRLVEQLDYCSTKSTPSNVKIGDGEIIIGTLAVSIIQRRLRVLDTLVVSYEGVPLWLPLLRRIKIRYAVRSFLLRISV